MLSRVLAGRKDTLDLTTDDVGDNQRRLEVDAIIFSQTKLDQTSVGFNFLNLAQRNFNDLAPNRLASHFFLVNNSDLYRAVSGQELQSEELDLDLLGAPPKKKAPQRQSLQAEAGTPLPSSSHGRSRRLLRGLCEPEREGPCGPREGGSQGQGEGGCEED